VPPAPGTRFCGRKAAFYLLRQAEPASPGSLLPEQSKIARVHLARRAWEMRAAGASCTEIQHATSD